MTPENGTPCIIYARVSTREQERSGLGLESQEARCADEAKRRGWQVVQVVRETIGGDRASRPLFAAACERARELGAVLLVAESSRLTRERAGVLPLYEMAGKQGWAVYALDVPELDFDTPTGEFLLSVLSAVNRLTRRVTGQRTSAALRAKVARGEPVGRPRTMAPETLAALRAFRAQGLSLERTAAALNEAGIPGAHGGRWAKRSVHMALRRYGEGNDDQPIREETDDGPIRDPRAVLPGDGGPGADAGAGQPGPARGAPGDDDLRAVLAHADDLDARAAALLDRHEGLLNDAARALRDSWDPGERNYGSVVRSRSAGFGKEDNPYAFNGGNQNSWHYLDGRRRNLAQYRDLYLAAARAEPDAPVFTAAVPAPPDDLVADLERAADLQVAAAVHRRHVGILRGDDGWAYDDEDRALARAEVERLLAAARSDGGECLAHDLA